jgi:glycosyltransferase involved in cell wall biosynthesis
MPTHFICSSQHSARILGQQFRVSDRLVSTVTDGVGGPAPPKKSKLVTRASLGLPKDTVLVVYSGGLQEGKGLAMLQQLIFESKKQLLPLHFLVIGYPEASLKAYLVANDLGNICTIVGRVPFEDLGDYLSLADIAVDPKQAAAGEASGKILNYMAAGLPVICFGSPGNTDLLGGAGFFTESGTIADFMEKLSYLANRPDERRRMGKAAQARVVGKFSWDCGADSIYEIYGKCLNPP